MKKDQNKKEAFQAVAEVLEIPVEEVENEGSYFEDLTEAFKWVYVEEAYTSEDMISLVELLGGIRSEDIEGANVSTVSEYIALQHENIYNTEFGVVYFVR